MSDWFDLTHLCGIQVTGRDAIEFCQAQFTADFRELTPGQWQICAWCDPKGRCLSVILASADENGVDLIAPENQIVVLKKLSLYAIGRKVDFSEALPVTGSLDPGKSTNAPQLPDGRALRLNDSPSVTSAQSLLEWRIADLCLPLPWLSSHSSGRYLPQFLGLEKNRGLSYHKGCFPGQEVIARVHYLGKVKHRLSGFVLANARKHLELESSHLTIEDSDQTAELLEYLPVNNVLIGLAVCPSDLASNAPVSGQTADGPLSGQMTDPKRLCYYRSINND